jgi:hypothetical protein
MAKGLLDIDDDEGGSDMAGLMTVAEGSRITQPVGT